MIEEYFKAFEAEDLKKIEELFGDDICLQDPFVGKVEGKDRVLDIYQDMFANNSFQLTLKRRFEANACSHAVEFSLIVIPEKGDPIRVDGVDLIEMRDNRIVSLRAYLDTSVKA